MGSTDLLDQRGVTRKNRRVFWASGLRIFLAAYDLSIMAEAGEHGTAPFVWNIKNSFLTNH